MLTERLVSFLLWIPVIFGQSQVELDVLQERILIEGAGCNCTEEINKTKQQVDKKMEELENQNKNLQDQYNTLQLKLDRLQERSDGHEACFEDLGSDNCTGSKSGLIGIVEAIRVDGGWGPFSDWSQCSAPCGGGVQVRKRTCNNPAPENGGKPCTGNEDEQRSCNADQCFDPCKESLCSSEDGCPLVRNTLLTTLPQLNKEFNVSFEFRATQYIKGWQSVIHFTEGGNCCGVGQRVPGFWVSNFGQLYPRFSVNGDSDYGIMTREYSLNDWHSVEFSQTLKNGKYMYQVVIDGKEVIVPMENRQPKQFYNVKVHAADSHYNTLKGSIKNLVINGCGDSTSCPQENGFCVLPNGLDQNAGVIKLDDIDGNIAGQKEKCLQKCLSYPGASTGCEIIWNQSNRGCYVHTQEVDRGNGIGKHACWIFTKRTGGRGAAYDLGPRSFGYQGRFNLKPQRGSRRDDPFGRSG